MNRLKNYKRYKIYLLIGKVINDSVILTTSLFSETEHIDPLRNRSGELLAKAILLKNATPPLSLQKEEIKKAMIELEKQCFEIDKLKIKNAKSEVLKKKISDAHDRFHIIQGLCHD